MLLGLGCASFSGLGAEAGRYGPVLRDGWVFFEQNPMEAEVEYSHNRPLPPVHGDHGGGGIAAMTIICEFKIPLMDHRTQARVSSARDEFVHLQVSKEHPVVVYSDAGRISLGLFHAEPGKWHHLALSIRPGATHLYLNGVRYAESEAQFREISRTSHLRIGRGWDDRRECLGDIRNIGIYRAALNQDEVKALFTSAKKRSGTTRIQWRMPTVFEWAALAGLAGLAAWKGSIPVRQAFQKRLEWSRREFWIAAGVLVCGLAVTWVGLEIARGQTERRDLHTFRQEYINVLERFDTRLELYALAIEKTGDFLELAPTASRNQWLDYMDRMVPSVNFKGMAKIGYLASLSGNADTQRLRERSGIENFRITINTNAPMHAVHVFRFDGMTPRGWPQPKFGGYGHDLESDSALWQALQRATQQRAMKAVVPAKIGMNERSGIALYVPVFGGGSSLDGFAYGIIDVQTFIETAFPTGSIDLTFQIYPQQDPSPENSLAHYNLQRNEASRRDSRGEGSPRSEGTKPRFIEEASRPVWGTSVRFVFASTPAFDARSLAHWPRYVGYFGATVTGLAALTAFIRSRARATEREMLCALQATNASLNAALKDRERISRDLHDGAIQSVYGVGLELQHCRNLLKRSTEEAGEQLSETLKHLNSVIGELRAFLVTLEPEMLNPATLGRIIHELVERLQRTHPARFVVEVDEKLSQDLATEQAIHVVHIVREGLSNSLRHAEPKQVSLSLSRLNGNALLRIADDGTGFEAGGNGAGRGLANIKARADELGGNLEVESQPKNGTEIRITFPIESKTDATKS